MNTKANYRLRNIINTTILCILRRMWFGRFVELRFVMGLLVETEGGGVQVNERKGYKIIQPDDDGKCIFPKPLICGIIDSSHPTSNIV